MAAEGKATPEEAVWIGLGLGYAVSADPSTARRYILNSEDVPLDLTAVVWAGRLEITAQADRYGDMTRIITVEPDAKGGVTYGSLFFALHMFYTEGELTEADFKEVGKLVNDIFGYKAAAMKSHGEGKTVNWIDLLGDAVHFEGLCVNPKTGKARLWFGS